MSKQSRFWTLAGGLALAVIFGAGAMTVQRRNAQEEAQRRGVRPPLEFTQTDIARLQEKRLWVETELPGTVQAVSQATVRAKLNAEVKRVLVREGDTVKAGQTVAEFDTAQLRAQLAERAATLEQARAQLATSERTRHANAQLVKQNFISQNAFDTADGAYQAQLASVAASTAQRDQTQILLDDAIVRAPISGMVGKRHVQPGEKVAFDAPLLSIVDLSQLEVQVQAPLTVVAAMRAGMPAKVEVEGIAGRTFAGRLERINPSAETGTRMIHVYVSLKNEGSLLKSGMFARVTLTTGAERAASALPLSAVRGEGAAAFVWVISGDRLARRSVVTGLRDERAQLLEIVSGLQPAEVVLATKFDNLEDGLAVKILAGGASTTAGPPAPKPAPPPG
ncbi:MAG: efflux RND transporter periplasmic adaptor subunit [Burkholderiales bacterium]